MSESAACATGYKDDGRGTEDCVANTAACATGYKDNGKGTVCVSGIS